MTTRVAFVLLVLCLGFGVGCSGTGSNSSIPVTGRVTVGGGVWERGGSVLFQSDVTSETSVIDTQGRFALRLPPGTYRVAIEPPGGLPVERPEPPEIAVLLTETLVISLLYELAVWTRTIIFASFGYRIVFSR